VVEVDILGDWQIRLIPAFHPLINILRQPPIIKGVIYIIYKPLERPRITVKLT
jgi:hypothetical protein